MNIRKVLLGAALTLLLIFYAAGGAHATIITATWNGTVQNGTYAGQLAVITFKYDLSQLGARKDIADFAYWDSSTFNFYSTAKVSLSGGTVVSFPPDPGNVYASLILGDATKTYKNFYQNHLHDNAAHNYLDAYFFDTVGGITNLNPGQTFTVSNFAGHNAGASFQFGLVEESNIVLSSFSVTSSDQVSVPAPGALVLLGLGLVGLGATRQQKLAA
jgi:hypothetical protein